MSEAVLRQANLDAMIVKYGRQPMQWSEPSEFDLTSHEDRGDLAERFASGEIRSVYDPIDEIANDLFDLRHPDKKDDEAGRAQFAEGIKEQGNEFGTWFHFPWSGELVRYPFVDDHRALRTSRNRNLITESEQQRLYDATVAVFGLSVGSNVVERLVSSGIGGTIVMGDPDHIEPSNLNRINGGFTDVGVKKIDLMARKISETDPYIKQVHFRDGVTRSNLGHLATLGPDVLFDEVDDLAMKASLRTFAQEQAIPLLMATDLGDRSLIDVERHDKGNAKPFNGRLKAEEVAGLSDGSLTEQEIQRMMVKIVGMRHVTTRMLESVMEVGNTLPGMPQLGNTASMGASLATVAAREILLGRRVDSGRYVLSPKQVLDLDPQTGLVDGLKTVLKFVKSSKQQ